VVRHDDVERAIRERQLLHVARAGLHDLNAVQNGHGANGRLHHAIGQIGQCEPEVGEQ